MDGVVPIDQVWPAYGAELENRASIVVSVFGRLRPGVSLSAARVAVRLKARQLERAYPVTNKNVGTRPRARTVRAPESADRRPHAQPRRDVHDARHPRHARRVCEHRESAAGASRLTRARSRGSRGDRCQPVAARATGARRMYAARAAWRHRCGWGDLRGHSRHVVHQRRDRHSDSLGHRVEWTHRRVHDPRDAACRTRPPASPRHPRRASATFTTS